MTRKVAGNNTIFEKLKVPARISGEYDKKILVAIYPYLKFRQDFEFAVRFS